MACSNVGIVRLKRIRADRVVRTATDVGPARLGVARRFGWAALLGLVVAVGSLVGAPASAAEDTRGQVLWTGGCGGRYAVETAKGQSLLEWYGGTEPKKGDTLAGDLDSRGFKELRIGTGVGKTRAYIDLVLATEVGVAEKLKKACPYTP